MPRRSEPQAPVHNEKVARVMHEFKEGSLRSSSGQKVKNPKQAIAIGLSEARASDRASSGPTRGRRRSPPRE